MIRITERIPLRNAWPQSMMRRAPVSICGGEPMMYPQSASWWRES
jgi:hypothetical protein